MLFLILACLSEKDITGISDIDTSTEDADSSPCFVSPLQDPYLIYATPYLEDGSQSSTWILQPKNGSSQSFSMGRATTGTISISTDGSWGAIPQGDGSLGIFRIQNGQITILNEGLVLATDTQDIYTTQIWLDSDAGRLWAVDSNWPNNGGGLFFANIDCESGEIGFAEQVFSSKNAAMIAPFTSDSMIFLSREVNEQPQHLTIFDSETQERMQTAQAFDDDDSIFSTLATDGQNILAGDNSAFSGIPNRISHLKLTENILEKQTTFEVEDPISIKIHDGLALISSGFGDALWQYNLETAVLEQVPLSPSIELPSGIVQRDGHFYVGETTGIRHLIIENGYFVDQGYLLDTNGLEGIIGAFGLFGEY
jgi:hypothetical protein